MASNRRNRTFIARANRSLGENVSRGESTMFTAYGLLGAILVFGVLGYLLDRFLATSPYFLAGGLVVGALIGLLSVYRLARRT